MAASESDERLVTRAVNGDADALDALLARYGPQVRSELKIERRWQTLLEADDIMQVSYLEAFLQIRSFTPGGAESFLAWLRRIARNNLLDSIRELERSKRPPPARRIDAQRDDSSYLNLFELCGGTATTPSRDAARRELKDVIETALRKLPPDYERVVRLFNLQGRPAAEVAQEMGRSVGAVHLLRMRAHERLREALGSSSRYFSDGA
jgi:RNA polymerase sigma-70 factor (ECF subfamily)